MIEAEVYVSFECDHCDKKFKTQEDNFKGNILCNKCYENHFEDCAKELIKKLVECEIWKDREHYIGFENEEQKDIFLDGVREGISQALHYIYSDLDLEEYYCSFPNVNKNGTLK